MSSKGCMSMSDLNFFINNRVLYLPTEHQFHSINDQIVHEKNKIGDFFRDGFVIIASVCLDSIAAACSLTIGKSSVMITSIKVTISRVLCR